MKNHLKRFGFLYFLGILLCILLPVLWLQRTKAEASGRNNADRETITACAQVMMVQTGAPELSGTPGEESSGNPCMVSAMDVMCAPSGLALTEDGTLLITDTFNKRLWQVQDGASRPYAGAETVPGLYGEPVGGYHDAELLTSYFGRPWAVAAFLDGWAVSDTDNNAIRILQNQEVRTLNVRTENGTAAPDADVAFDRPTGLAADQEGNLYVSDTGNGMIRRITPEGLATTAAAGLDEPMGLCWKDGVLYIAETGANRILTLKNGTVSPLAGSGEDGMEDGHVSQATFSGPQGVAVGDDGTVYVADTLNSALRQIRGGQVETVTARDTSLADFGLISPSGLLLQENRLYICDGFARKLFMLELD